MAIWREFWAGCWARYATIVAYCSIFAWIVAFSILTKAHMNSLQVQDFLIGLGLIPVVMMICLLFSGFLFHLNSKLNLGFARIGIVLGGILSIASIVRYFEKPIHSSSNILERYVEAIVYSILMTWAVLSVFLILYLVSLKLLAWIVAGFLASLDHNPK